MVQIPELITYHRTLNTVPVLRSGNRKITVQAHPCRFCSRELVPSHGTQTLLRNLALSQLHLVFVVTPMSQNSCFPGRRLRSLYLYAVRCYIISLFAFIRFLAFRVFFGIVTYRLRIIASGFVADDPYPDQESF